MHWGNEPRAFSLALPNLESSENFHKVLQSFIKSFLWPETTLDYLFTNSSCLCKKKKKKSHEKSLPPLLFFKVKLVLLYFMCFSLAGHSITGNYLQHSFKMASLSPFISFGLLHIQYSSNTIHFVSHAFVLLFVSLNCITSILVQQREKTVRDDLHLRVLHLAVKAQTAAGMHDKGLVYHLEDEDGNFSFKIELFSLRKKIPLKLSIDALVYYPLKHSPKRRKHCQVYNELTSL